MTDRGRNATEDGPKLFNLCPCLKLPAYGHPILQCVHAAALRQRKEGEREREREREERERERERGRYIPIRPPSRVIRRLGEGMRDSRRSVSHELAKPQ